MISGPDPIGLPKKPIRETPLPIDAADPSSKTNRVHTADLMPPLGSHCRHMRADWLQPVFTFRRRRPGTRRNPDCGNTRSPAWISLVFRAISRFADLLGLSN